MCSPFLGELLSMTLLGHALHTSKDKRAPDRTSELASGAYDRALLELLDDRVEVRHGAQLAHGGDRGHGRERLGRQVLHGLGRHGLGRLHGRLEHVVRGRVRDEADHRQLALARGVLVQRLEGGGGLGRGQLLLGRRGGRDLLDLGDERAHERAGLLVRGVAREAHEARVLVARQEGRGLLVLQAQREQRAQHVRDAVVGRGAAAHRDRERHLRELGASDLDARLAAHVVRGRGRHGRARRDRRKVLIGNVCERVLLHARGDQRRVASVDELSVEGRELRAVQVVQVVRREHGAAQRRVVVEGRRVQLLEHERRRVGRQLVLLGAHERLLRVHVPVRKLGRERRLGQDLRRRVQLARQHADTVAHRLAAREGADRPADGLDIAVQAQVRARLRGAEGHLGEERRHAGRLVRLVARAGLELHGQRGHGPGAVVRGDLEPRDGLALGHLGGGRRLGRRGRHGRELLVQTHGRHGAGLGEQRAGARGDTRGLLGHRGGGRGGREHGGRRAGTGVGGGKSNLGPRRRRAVLGGR